MHSIIQQFVHDAQSFGALDLLTISTLAVLECMLSVDNALVLAIMVRGLPHDQRRKALTYGLVGAFVFRIIALIFASYIMRFGTFKLIGGGYLLFLALKHLFFASDHLQQVNAENKTSFWRTVVAVELTDIVFSIDSITTAVAMSDKLLIVWLGGILGIVGLRFLSSFFIRLLERFPKLEDLAYQLVFFIGVKLVVEFFHLEMSEQIFWMMMGVITVLGISMVYRDHRQKKNRNLDQKILIEKLQTGVMPVREVLELKSIPREVLFFLHEQGYLRIDEEKSS